MGEIVGDEVKHTEMGDIVERCWQWLASHHAHVELDNYVIMPNHQLRFS